MFLTRIYIVFTFLGTKEAVMEKYTITFKHNSGVQVNHPNHQKWVEATPETHPSLFDVTKIVVTQDRIFRKQPKHNTGVINRRAAGGKWEEITERVLRRFTTIHQYIIACEAIHADFRGCPKLK